MTVALVGEGPAAEAVAAALEDVEEEVEWRETVGDCTLGVVVGAVGDEAFAAANRSETPWLALELGGVGGHAVAGVEASVAGFSPDTACLDCLRGRVAANLGEEGTDDGSVGASTARFAGALAGREAVRALEGTSNVFGGLVEVPYADRRVLPLPHCSCSDAPDRQIRRDHVDRPLEASLGRAEVAVDDRVGIVSEVGEVESFPLPYYLSVLSGTEAFSDVQAAQQAAGVSADWNAAYMKAVGEGFERYAAGVFREAELVRAPAEQVDGAVPLSSFVLPEDADTGGPLAWVPGESLHTGESVHLPAPRVQFPLAGAGPTITTGLGLGNSGVEALVAGLTEVVERDAAMLAWYSTFDPLGLRIDDEEVSSATGAGEAGDGSDPGFGTLRRRARAEGLTVSATLLTQNVDVPVVACAVHREREWPQFALGTAAALDPVAAAESACAEALQNWTELRRMGKAGATDAGGRIGHFASLPDSARAFTDPETTIPIGSVASDVPDAEEELDALLEALGKVDLDAYAARLTTRDLDVLGFEAVRVLVPQAQPLFIDGPYFGERATTVPESLGFEPRLDREHHPFP
ncbi:YcaO-like family protein [Halomarina oriensis]|uniref:Bacteriocin biosynthesis protein SagD n=1 Tax=Halomarina oriensis TaxID=671145 RepID=A0A6B0GPH7_9EURY|nr:YcaO-like family protein [Halomarina oriensis]MWG36734.1 bacteriocin biosynthesis protein SagD [Halomarina oriensis]